MEAVFTRDDVNLHRTFMLCYYNIMRMAEVWALSLVNISMDGELPVITIEQVKEANWRPKMGKPRRMRLH